MEPLNDFLPPDVPDLVLVDTLGPQLQGIHGLLLALSVAARRDVLTPHQLQAGLALLADDVERASEVLARFNRTRPSREF